MKVETISFPLGVIYVKFILNTVKKHEIDKIAEFFKMNKTTIIHAEDENERRKLTQTLPLLVYSPSAEGFLYVLVSPNYGRNLIRSSHSCPPMGFIHVLKTDTYYTVYPEFYVGKQLGDDWSLAYLLRKSRKDVKGALYNPDLEIKGAKVTGKGYVIDKKKFLKEYIDSIRDKARLN